MTRRRPAFVGRMRTSTLVLVLVFVGATVLYLFVRPTAASQVYVRVPASDVTPRTTTTVR